MDTLTGTASWLEIIGAIINVVGLIAAGVMYSRTKRRENAVKRSPDYIPGGPRIMTGERHIRAESDRVAYHVVSLFFGIWSLWIPGPMSLYGYALMFSRIALAVKLTWSSVLDVIRDEQLSEVLRPRETQSRGQS